jgi:V/A-type H+-transporting ATPase subunit I
MIISMHKYSFLVYHKEYDSFLKNLQGLGALHVIEKAGEVDENTRNKYLLVNQIDEIIKFLEKRGQEQTDEASGGDPSEIIQHILEKQKQLEQLHQDLVNAKKAFQNVLPWGEFSNDLIAKLKEENYHIRFFVTSKKKFSPELFDEYYGEIISTIGNQVYFIIIQRGDEELIVDAEEVKQPDNPPAALEERMKKTTQLIDLTNQDLDQLARTCIPMLQRKKESITAALEYEKVTLNTVDEADEKMKVLEGWVPVTKKAHIDDFLDRESILYFVEKPEKKDQVPVLLKNNRFSKLFEPIGELFSLPNYFELDLTVYFAPFFMMFFGFCLGDAGYGLLFLIGAGLYKLQASKSIKPLLSLIQWLGAATVLFGIISGTFFGINLIDADIELLESYKSTFLDPDKMFNLALILGGLQIIFGVTVKAANQIKQFGFMHALATVGWLIILIGSGIYLLLSEYNIIEANSIVLYTILSLGAFLIIFFSDIRASVPARIGKGIWDIYSTVTGIFGDLLSYIRLFALGLSSAILGFVINDIALQILGSSKVLGPIFFVIFLLLGHGLNILISSLGSFVHPMRLTFVEFYKNAGFAGGGKAYKPFQ